MKEKIIKILPYLAIVLLFVFIAYGQTLKMYFWQDDSALLFKLQHPAEAAGSFGAGLWERSPYQYLVVPFVPFFPLFGLKPFGYFLVGFLGYLLVTFFFWLFIKQIYKNNKHAYIATLVFSAGYIGSEIMFRIINSWQTEIGLILALITLYFYAKYFNNFRFKNYLLALGFYLFTIEAVFIRSHSLIFAILSLDILYTLLIVKKKGLGIVNILLRQIPFWFLFYKWYIAGESIGGNSLGGILKQIILGKFEILTSLFATVGNALVPDILQEKFVNRFQDISHFLVFLVLLVVGILLLSIFTKSIKTKIAFLVTLIFLFILNNYFYSLDLRWYRTDISIVQGFIGFYGLVLSFFLALVWWRQYPKLAIAIIFGYIFLVSQIFGYFVQYPDSIFGTTHRYLSNAFIGYTIFYGTLFSALYVKFNSKKIVYLFPLALLLLTNLYFGYRYQKDIVVNRSIPSQKFYEDLKSFVPSIEKGSIFYFDVERNPYFEKQFGDFFSVGSMPETTALAIYYGVDRYDLFMFTNFDELVSKLGSEATLIDKVYTFYYGEGGLKNTTHSTRSLLTKQNNPQPLVIKDKKLTSEKISTLTPQILNLTLKASAERIPNFPYSFTKDNLPDLSFEKRIELLKYLATKENYYKNVKATSLSEWKYSEINYVVDNNPDTAWQSHRTRWDKIKDDNVTVDLGSVKRIDKVYWTNSRNTLTPIDYQIFVSLNGSSWNLVKSVTDGGEKKNGEIVLEKFEQTNARFVKMQITKTFTTDSPSIAEIEIVEANINVDPAQASLFIKNPFGTVRNQMEWNSLYQHLKSLAKMQINFYTDKNKTGTSIETPLNLDGKIHNYQIITPQSGTKLDKIEIVLNFPANVEILSASMANLSITNLKERNLIKYFSTN